MGARPCARVLGVTAWESLQVSSRGVCAVRAPTARGLQPFLVSLGDCAECGARRATVGVSAPARTQQALARAGGWKRVQRARTRGCAPAAGALLLYPPTTSRGTLSPWGWGRGEG